MEDNTKISIQDMTKVFYKKNSSVTALDHISLNISEGEFVCLVGPSGCGKTTLLRILAGLETTSVGEFKIVESEENRPLQSMVFQERGVIPWLSVEDNVAFGLKMRHLPAELIKERTSYYLEKVGLEKFSTLYPKDFLEV